jgi:DNA-binding NarL/FixJ family response regulator
MTVRVLLADDQTLVREAFALLVESARDMAVVGQAGTGRRAVELPRSERADLVVMDVRMPGLDGIEAIRLIAGDEDLAGVKVLVLTTYDTDENIVEALRAGASGFLVKDTRPAELLDAIRTVAAGEALLSPGPTARLIERFPRGPSAPAPAAGGPDCLSDREREVLTLVARGLNNTEIADALGLSPLTAKTHVSRIMGKLGARDRAQLVIVAFESGLVTPGSGRRTGRAQVTATDRPEGADVASTRGPVAQTDCRFTFFALQGHLFNRPSLPYVPFAPTCRWCEHVGRG